jgi:hypothetical protein
MISELGLESHRFWCPVELLHYTTLTWNLQAVFLADQGGEVVEG